MPESAILAAWERRVSAHEAILADRNLSDEAAAPIWSEVDAADAVLNGTVASSLPEIEVQLWAALHASDAALPDDAPWILRRDLHYVVSHKANFDWTVWPLIAALIGLRKLAQ